MANEDIYYWAQVLPILTQVSGMGYAEDQLRGQAGYLIGSPIDHSQIPRVRAAPEYFDYLFAFPAERDVDKSNAQSQTVSFRHGTALRWTSTLVFNKAAGGCLWDWLITDVEDEFATTPEHLTIHSDGFVRGSAVSVHAKPGVTTIGDRKPVTAAEADLNSQSVANAGAFFSLARPSSVGNFDWSNAGLNSGSRWAAGAPAGMSVSEVASASGRYDIEIDALLAEQDPHGNARRARSVGNRVGPTHLPLFQNMRSKSKVRTNWPREGVWYGETRLHATHGREIVTVNEAWQGGGFDNFYPCTFSETYIFDARNGTPTYTNVTGATLYAQQVNTTVTPSNVWVWTSGSSELETLIDTAAWPAHMKVVGARLPVNLAGVVAPIGGGGDVNANNRQALIKQYLGGFAWVTVNVAVVLPAYNSGDPYNGGTLTFPIQRLDTAADLSSGFDLYPGSLTIRPSVGTATKLVGLEVRTGNPYVQDSAGRCGIVLRCLAGNPRSGAGGGLEKRFPNDFCVAHVGALRGKTTGDPAVDPPTSDLIRGLSWVRFDPPAPNAQTGSARNARYDMLSMTQARNLDAPAVIASGLTDDVRKNPLRCGSFGTLGTLVEVQERIDWLAANGWLTFPITGEKYGSVT